MAAREHARGFKIAVYTMVRERMCRPALCSSCACNCMCEALTSHYSGGSRDLGVVQLLIQHTPATGDRWILPARRVESTWVKST